MQKSQVIMADENNSNGDGVLIYKAAGHHNQLYVLIYLAHAQDSIAYNFC